MNKVIFIIISIKLSKVIFIKFSKKLTISRWKYASVC